MADIDYFRNLVKTEKNTLEENCTSWREHLTSQEVPKCFEGDVLVAIGQSELLIRERFVQFYGLIDDCYYKRGEKETTCGDLQGFWDIIYFQVEDVNKKFLDLGELKKLNWQKPEPKPLVVKKVLKPLCPNRNLPVKPKVTVKGSSAMRAHILAARQRLKNSSGIQQGEKHCEEIINVQRCSDDKENKSINSPNIMKPQISGGKENSQSNNLKSNKSPGKAVFDGGFFKVVTPVKKIQGSCITELEKSNLSGNLGKVLSSAVLRERIRTTPVVHKDYSPCIRITRSMKMKGLGMKLDFDT